MKLPSIAKPVHRQQAVPVAHARGVAPSAIQFVQGWNGPNNNDLRGGMTAQQIQTALENYSNDLSSTINSARCRVRVHKGCHQANDPHITISENNGRCNNATYAGTNSVHIPC